MGTPAPLCVRPVGALLGCLALGGVLSASTADAAGVPVTGTASVGFSNQYNFRGFNAGDWAPWVLVDLDLPLGPNGTPTLDAGGWFIDPLEDGTAEIGLYTFLIVPVADFSFSVGGRFFIFPQDDSTTGEFGATARYQFPYDFDLELAWWTDVKGDGVPGDELRFGHYAELSVGKSLALCDWLSVALRAGASYTIDYYDSDGWNNAFASIAVPIGISERFTVTPTVGGSLALEGIRDAGEDDYFLAGISLSFEF